MSNKRINHAESVITSYKKLFESGKFSDAILVVGDTEIPCHAAILASKSEFFEILFYENQFLEGQQTKKTIHAPVQALKLVLEYMYTGTADLTKKSEKVLLELLELSRRFLLPTLEEAMIDKLIEIVSVKNWFKMMKTADLMESKALQRKCWDTVAGDVTKFIASADFMKLTEEQMTKFVSNLALLQIEKFQVISKWLSGHEECSVETKESLLASVHLNRLTNNQLIKIVNPTKLCNLEKLMEIMASRSHDIEEEIKEIVSGFVLRIPNYNFCTPYIEVIHGLNVKNLFKKSDDSFCIAERINNEWRLTLDLGTTRMINFISFNLNKQKPVDYHLYTTLCPKDNALKKNVGYFRGCSREQKHYFDEAKRVRYIFILGKVNCNAFGVYYKPDVAVEIAEKLKNPLAPEYAFTSIGNDGNRLLDKGFREMGRNTICVTVPASGIEISLKQPSTFHSVRIRLWDFTDKGQDFKLITISKDGIAKLCCERRNAFGWQVFEISRCQGYRGIKIAPVCLSKKLLLAHVEASNE